MKDQVSQRDWAWLCARNAIVFAWTCASCLSVAAQPPESQSSYEAAPMGASEVCAGEWSSTGWGYGLNLNHLGSSISINAITDWDPDGDGPAQSQIIAAGDFLYGDGRALNHIARWDGVQWQPFSTGLGAGVRALLSWDPDGEGPAAPILLAAGVALRSATTSSNVVRWNGTAWETMSGLTNSQGFDPVNALVSWDPDGPGGAAPQLLAAGEFSRVNDIIAKGLALWNGTAWTVVPTPFNLGRFSAATLWDPDGPGGSPARLVVSGSVQSQVPPYSAQTWAWDGSDWTALHAEGELNTRDVDRLFAWDPDGAGPKPEILIASGWLQNEVTGVRCVACWNGSNWESLGEISVATYQPSVRAFAAFPLDPTNPLKQHLVAAGRFDAIGATAAERIAYWDGASWHALGWDPGSGVVYDLMTHDPDGAGPVGTQLIVAGEFQDVGESINHSIASWDGEQWNAVGTPLGEAIVQSLIAWKPGERGAGAEELVATGNFWLGPYSSYPNRGAARWNGSSWIGMGNHIGSNLKAITKWDSPDGEQLIAAGLFLTPIGGNYHRGVARWDGAIWQPLFSSFPNGPIGIATWDADGEGPGAAEVVTSWQGVSGNEVAQWTGAQWQTIGSVGTGSIAVITTWDSDGTGPELPQLVVAGQYSNMSGISANRIAHWNGVEWQPFGTGIANQPVVPGFPSLIAAVETFDPDGAGAESPLLIAAGRFNTAGGVACSNIAAWRDGQWSPLGSGTNGVVLSLGVWDPDGAGPAQPLLVAGGQFTEAGGVAVNRAAAWDGTSWSAVGDGANGDVYAIAAFDVDGPGPERPRLGIGGIFSQAGEVLTNAVATWSCATPPPCPGDANRDGVVNFDDITAVIANWLLVYEAGAGVGDGNLDGRVGMDDIDAVLSNWLTACR